MQITIDYLEEQGKDHEAAYLRRKLRSRRPIVAGAVLESYNLNNSAGIGGGHSLYYTIRSGRTNGCGIHYHLNGIGIGIGIGSR